MPKKGQKAVTVPERIWEIVEKEVRAGREKSVSSAFVRAVELYLDTKKRETLVDSLDWLEKRLIEIRAKGGREK